MKDLERIPPRITAAQFYELSLQSVSDLELGLRRHSGIELAGITALEDGKNEHGETLWTLVEKI